jgi:hypothetical protein
VPPERQKIYRSLGADRGGDGVQPSDLLAIGWFGTGFAK